MGNHCVANPTWVFNVGVMAGKTTPQINTDGWEAHFDKSSNIPAPGGILYSPVVALALSEWTILEYPMHRAAVIRAREWPSECISSSIITSPCCVFLVELSFPFAAVLPNEVALGHSAGYWLAPEQDPEYPFVLATVLNSLLADYQARMYLTGINLSKYLVEMIYMPTPDNLRREIAVIDGVETSVWEHLLSLSFQLHHEWNYLQHPLSNNSPERAVKNPLAAIDALLAKQAGLSRSMFEWMIGRFNIWERQIGTEALLVDRLQWFDAIQILKENLP